MASNKQLLERIKAAKTSEEAKKLLEEGKTYKFASFGTRRKWVRAAAKKVA